MLLLVVAGENHRYCQVDEKLVDRPPRYWARASRKPAMLGIKNGRRPQLDNTPELSVGSGRRAACHHFALHVSAGANRARMDFGCSGPEFLLPVAQAACDEAIRRISEIAALDVSDIREAPDGSGRLVIRASKTDQTGKGETLYIGTETVASVRAWLSVSGIESGPLFLSTRGRRIGQRIGAASVHHVIVKRLKAAGAKGRLGGHSLRRGSAASLVEAGASLPEVMESGRWIDPKMVRAYLRGQLTDRDGIAKYRYAAE